MSERYLPIENYLLDGIEMPICICNSEGRIVIKNKACAKQGGLRRGMPIASYMSCNAKNYYLKLSSKNEAEAMPFLMLRFLPEKKLPPALAVRAFFGESDEIMTVWFFSDSFELTTLINSPLLYFYSEFIRGAVRTAVGLIFKYAESLKLKETDRIPNNFVADSAKAIINYCFSDPKLNGNQDTVSAFCLTVRKCCDIFFRHTNFKYNLEIDYGMNDGIILNIGAVISAFFTVLKNVTENSSDKQISVIVSGGYNVMKISVSADGYRPSEARQKEISSEIRDLIPKECSCDYSATHTPEMPKRIYRFEALLRCPVKSAIGVVCLRANNMTGLKLSESPSELAIDMLALFC